MNRLSDSGSPYLLQHAENPVDWFPWCDDAFDRAKAEDKPVLVSIGYSACHWCHVMAHESFENPTTAQFMNDHFVSVKVDREERPDVDSVYMEAVQALTGQGGWPLNVFVTPDRKPFFGGTYFPPSPRHGMPSWPQVLHSIAVAWRDNRSDLQRQASALLTHLQQRSSFTSETPELVPAVLDSAFDSLRASFDWNQGGFGSGPKFPNVLIMQFLLRYWARTGNPEPLRMVKLSLERMAGGGLRDHVGGGFHRYTVDRAWVVPHFEKMLYDNALLAQIYTEAWQATRSEHYRRAATETLDYLLRDMRAPEGTFYSAEDADSDGMEGRFYVWSPEEIDAVLPGSEASLVRMRYGITDQGNFGGLNIPNLSQSLESLARSARISVEDLERVLTQSVAKLRNARAARMRPGLDTKVLTDWNALVISSLAFAGHAFCRPDYLDSASKAAEALRSRAWVDVSGDGMPVLRHLTSSKSGHVDGFLADYAYLLGAVLTLFESTGESRWIDWASSVSREMVNRFSDGAGSFHFVTATASDLPTQPRDIADGVVPSGTTAALMGLLRLARITGDSSFDSISQAGLMKLSAIMSRYALSFGHGLAALDLYLSEPIELVVVKADEDSDCDLEALAASCYLPNLIRITAPYRLVMSSSLSLLAGKAIDPERSYAFLCERGSCGAPVSDVSSLWRQLEPLLPSSGPD